MTEDNPTARETIPDRFESVEEAAEFWDHHDVAAYEDLTREAHFEIDLDRRNRGHGRAGLREEPARGEGV